MSENMIPLLDHGTKRLVTPRPVEGRLDHEAVARYAWLAAQLALGRLAGRAGDGQEIN